MKMKKIYNLLLVAGTISLTSCSDYLSEVPDNRTQIDSEEKIQELLVGAYPVSAYAPFLEPMTDNFEDKGNLEATTDEFLRSYSWEEVITDRQDTPTSYWSRCYSAIAHANQALVSIAELEGKPDMDLSAEKGEALVARAYAHFMLVNIWGKHYNPTTGASLLGVPYVLEPETEAIKQYTRSSVEEVYQLIEKDLTEGLALLSNEYSQPKFHFTPEAGHAFASRFYLYKGDWDKVIEHSNKILNNVNEKLRDWNYYQDNLQIDEISAEVMGASESANLLISVPISYMYTGFARNRFGLSVDKKEELFDALNPYGKPWAYQQVQFANGGLTWTINKYDRIFEYTDITAGIGYQRTSMAMLTHDETLLARAEAYVMKNNFDAAAEDLNTFLAKKTRNYTNDVLTATQMIAQIGDASEYAPYYELSNDQSKLIKFIAEIRRREFYNEGLRWFDIKRFNIPVTHDFIDQNSDVLTADDNRKAVQIPISARTFGLEANPR